MLPPDQLVALLHAVISKDGYLCGSTETEHFVTKKGSKLAVHLYVFESTQWYVDELDESEKRVVVRTI